MDLAVISSLQHHSGAPINCSVTMTEPKNWPNLWADANSIVMRGNGIVTAGKTFEETLVLAWYLEDAARVELDCLAAGLALDEFVLSETECEKRAVYTGQIMNLMWNYLIAGDPENT